MIDEIDSIHKQRNALIEEKKHLHAAMDSFKENYPEELRAFYLDEKYKSEIQSIQREK